MANNTGGSKRACVSIYFRFNSLLGCVHSSARPFLVRFLSNLVCRFTLRRTRTSSFGDATGSDLRACA